MEIVNSELYHTRWDTLADAMLVAAAYYSAALAAWSDLMVRIS